MDSFYDEPRSAPKPTSINQIPSCELVPEVSIILPPNNNEQTRKSPPRDNKKMSYSAWKSQNRYPQQTVARSRHDKENIARNMELHYNEGVSKASSRKQVRFDSPSNRKEILKPNSNQESERNISSDCANVNNNKTNATAYKPFEQIYMANIPNRHLDLSIIEVPSSKAQQIRKDQTSTKECNTAKDVLTCDSSFYKNIDSVVTTNVYSNKDYMGQLKPQQKFDYPHQQLREPHYNRYRTPQIDQLPFDNRNCDPIPQKSFDICTSNDKNQDPTVRDLLKVVQQQNEQILLLQKQVALLLQNQTSQKQIELPDNGKRQTTSHEPVSSTKIEQPQYNNPPRHARGPLSKFAIDVMTSFEVSIRPPQNFPSNKFNNEGVTGAKIEEIVETPPNLACNKGAICDVLGDIKRQVCSNNGGKQDVDLSLTLNGPLQVTEPGCPSPENSIHVDMQDYSSDSDDQSSNSSTDIGWTVYNNVMGQVNNMLKKADNKNPSATTNTNILADKTLQKVKEATMRHLKNVGINLPVIEEPNISERSNETVTGSEYTPTEISVAVKQLLMKYLPDDQLAKISEMANSELPKLSSNCNKENLIRRRPEFSFASIEYMKKYNLLTSDPTPQMMPRIQQNAEVPKILDVTALKQQPKLL